MIDDAMLDDRLSVANHQNDGLVTLPGWRAARSLPMFANAIALIGAKFVTLGLGFFAWLTAARLFDQSEVGLASGAVSAMMLCVQLALFGAGAAVITMYPSHREAPNRLINTSLALVALGSVGITALFLFFASGFFHELKVVSARASYVIVFLIMVVAGAIGVLLDQLSVAQRRGDQALVRGVVSGVVTLGFVVILPKAFGMTSALAILVAWALGNLSPVLVGWVQERRLLDTFKLRPSIEWKLARELTRFGFPNWILTLTERVPGAILPIVVIEILSPASNAAWYAAWMMAWVVYVVPVQVGLNLFAEAARHPNQVRRITTNALAISLAIGVLAAAAAAIAGPVLLGFLGSGYANEGTTPLRILLLAVIPITFIQVYFSICRSRLQLGEAIGTGLVSAITGVVAASFAGLSYGLVGMALAWLVSQTVVSVWALTRLHSLVYRDAVTHSASSQ